MIVKLAAIFFSMILVNNYVLVKFLGICRELSSNIRNCKQHASLCPHLL